MIYLQKILFNVKINYTINKLIFFIVLNDMFDFEAKTIDLIIFRIEVGIIIIK